MQVSMLDRVTTSLYMAHEKVEDGKEQDTCAKIKEIVLNALYTLIFYITCCQVDLREKEIVTPPSLLKYMRDHHNGVENKVLYKVKYSYEKQDVAHYAWYTEVNGKPTIVTITEDNFNDEHDFSLYTFQFNEDGFVETIHNTSQHVRMDEIANSFHFQLLCRQLQEAVKLPVKGIFLPKCFRNSKEERAKMWRDSLLYLKSNLHTKDHPLQLHSRATPLTEGRALNSYYTEGHDGTATITLIGMDIADKKLTITAKLSKDKSIQSLTANKLPVKKAGDYGFFEAMIWPEVLQDHVLVHQIISDSED